MVAAGVCVVTPFCALVTKERGQYGNPRSMLTCLNSLRLEAGDSRLPDESPRTGGEGALVQCCGGCDAELQLTEIMLRPVHFECVDFLGADIACDKGRIVGSKTKPGCGPSVEQRSGFLKIHYLFNLSIAHP